MLGIEKASLIIVFSSALFIGFYHLLSKNRSIIQILFSFLSFLLVAMSGIQIISVYAMVALEPTLFLRIYLVIFVLGCELSFHIVQLYPGRNIRKQIPYILLCSIPGLAISIITAMTSLVIKSAVIKDYPIIEWGQMAPAYVAANISYFMANPLLLTIRSFRTTNRAFAREMRYVSTGLFIILTGLIAFLAWLIILTPFASLAYYTVLPFCLLIFLVVTNHSIIDSRHIDYKNYYLRLIYWLLYISGLFIPVFILFINKGLLSEDSRISSLFISIISFIYMVFFFRYIRPVLENFFKREYVNLTRNFDDFFRKMVDLPLSGESQDFWDTFYKAYILGLRELFDISKGYFFSFNQKKKAFIYVYGFGEDILDDTIFPESPIINCFSKYSEMLYKSSLDSDPELLPFRVETKRFFKANGVEIALPFYNHHEQIAGILFLGLPPKKKSYSGAFIAALHLYRIQFQRQFSTRYIMEEIKATQIIEHDKMVLSLVKKKIIPSSLAQIEGFRLSSLYINNSDLGCDYYDSIQLDESHVALFISDCSYTGVDSAIAALGLYSVIHTPSKKFNANPSTILNSMNWVLNTSSYYNRHAPASCLVLSSQGELIFSGAAHNPLVLYDIAANEFHEHQGGGIPLGVDRNHRYENQVIRVRSGMIGFLYSDGAVTAINDRGENYGVERLRGVVQKFNNESAAAITRRIFMDMQNFLGDRKQQSDASVILFRT